RAARGGRGGYRGGNGSLAGVESSTLQNAQAFFLLGRVTEIRLRQGTEAAGARRTRSARPARSQSETNGMMMRSIVQPGPPALERVQWVEARGRAFTFTLEAGLPLLQAARRGFAREGFASGTLNIRSGALGPFSYV